MLSRCDEEIVRSSALHGFNRLAQDSTFKRNLRLLLLRSSKASRPDSLHFSFIRRASIIRRKGPIFFYRPKDFLLALSELSVQDHCDGIGLQASGS